MNTTNQITDMTPEEKKKAASKKFEERLSKISEKQKAQVLSLPKSYQMLAAKVYANDSSLREMVKLKCYDCVGFEDIKNEVGNCKIVLCALHSRRPHQKE